MKHIAVLAFLLVFVGCGKGFPRITSPAQGQTYPFMNGGAGQPIQVLLENYNDFDGTTTEFQNWEGTGYSCQNTANTPGACYFTGQQGGTVTQNCMQGKGCPIIIIVSRGDLKDIRVIYVGGQAAPAIANDAQ